MGVPGYRHRLGVKIIREVDGGAHTHSISSFHHDAKMRPSPGYADCPGLAVMIRSSAEVFVGRRTRGSSWDGEPAGVRVTVSSWGVRVTAGRRGRGRGGS